MQSYDVAIVGGALGGASAALLLRRRFPSLRVLVVERSDAFDWKVGESTVETSGYFLTRILNLYDHLSREQLPKQSLRYWFHNGRVSCLREASESGPSQLARLPAFQLDRSKLDEHVLALAAAAGADLWRPARVLEIRLAEETGSAENILRIERGGEEVEVRAPWVVDASGRAAIIARKRGMVKPLQEHPTAAIWARYRGVKDMDGPEVAGPDPDHPFVRASAAARRLATNHFVGYGYWIWFIPLKGGETSIGAVWDTRLVTPAGRTNEEKLQWFLEGNPLTRELMPTARLEPDDIRSYSHLPYLVDRVAGRGWSLVGDAAGFLDPFYSPGIDQVAYSVSWSLELIEKSRSKPDPQVFAEEIACHNRQYAQFMRLFFEAIFRDKYYLMGDYDTMTTAFLLDTALYYFFLVMPTYKSSRRLLRPPFYAKYSKYPATVMRFYQKRLIDIARRKMRLGIYGNHNAGRRPKLVGFSLGAGTWLMFLKGLAGWMRIEAENAWTYIARPRPMRAQMPTPLSTPELSR